MSRLGDPSKSRVCTAALAILAGALLFSGTAARAAEPTAPALTPKVRAFLESRGRDFELGLTPEGAITYRSEAVNPKVAERLKLFIERLPARAPEEAMARALQSYLKPRLAPRDLDRNPFLYKRAGGGLALTTVGRKALWDVLTAEDGTLLEEPRPSPPPSGPKTVVEDRVARNPRTAAEPLNQAASDSKVASNLFDGSGRQSSLWESSRLAAPHTDAGLRPLESPRGSAVLPQAGHKLESFDWAALDREVKVGNRFGWGIARTPVSVLDGYVVNPKKGTVRLLIAANKTAVKDRLQASEAAADEVSIYAEAGLDAGLLERHGAKAVRAVDNLIAVEVPIPQAAGLGQALEAQGIASRPSRLFKAAAGSALQSPALGLLGAQFLPLPSPLGIQGGGGLPGLERVSLHNAESRDRIGVESLWGRQMDGKYSVVAVLDTGIDSEHPDFKDRVVATYDFTGEGTEDRIGHGTHVAGTVGGSGAASEGLYKGMAPRTKFVVLKVFDQSGESSDDVILAAMKKASLLSGQERPDILNMSLGGPGDPNVDPVSSMANRLTVKDNILVIASAGNRGPSGDSISAPGNGRYVLTVTGIGKSGGFPDFASRGPVTESDGDSYAKPDLSAISGDVQVDGPPPLFASSQRSFFSRALPRKIAGALAAFGLGGGPAHAVSVQKCVYAPGIISTRSRMDTQDVCALDGNPKYRFMSGTSMAAPMASGVAADVAGYVKGNGAPQEALMVKAVLMETAQDLGKPREVQGAGLINGSSLGAAVAERVKLGLPIGNVAYMLSLRLTTGQLRDLKEQDRYALTSLGILDTQTNHLIRTDAELEQMLRHIRRRKGGRA